MIRNFVVFVALMFGTMVSGDSFDCFIRGDANGDGSLNIADSITALNYAMGGGGVVNDNLDAIDANDDGGINIADGIYIQSILFSGAVHLTPNFVTGIGLDPTVDNVNNEGSGEDEGDYSIGAIVSTWEDGTLEVGEVDGETSWPIKLHETVLGEDSLSRSGGGWTVATIPQGTYGKLVNSFESWFSMVPDWAQRQITVGQINEACRYGKNSGPGLRFAYAYAWNISMSMPNPGGYTSVSIDGRNAKLSIKLEVGPETAYIDVPINLKNVGIEVVGNPSTGKLARYCGGTFDNTCESAVGVEGVLDMGEQGGVVTVNVVDIRNALIPYTNLKDYFTIKVAGMGFLNTEDSPQVRHEIWNADATNEDSVSAMFLFSSPGVVTTTYEHPED